MQSGLLNQMGEMTVCEKRDGMTASLKVSSETNQWQDISITSYCDHQYIHWRFSGLAKGGLRD